MPYTSICQQKNLAWVLPRPKRDHYKGGMPLYCEEWLLALMKDILGQQEIKLLNLFCGMNRYGLRVDIKPEVEPDICCDAHQLRQYIDDTFDVILVDPPYSNDEARELYGTPKLRYRQWTHECIPLLRPGGLFIIYHKYVMPNPDSTQFLVAKRVLLAQEHAISRAQRFFSKKVR